MLWSEFKALVEKELQGKDPRIEYIDIFSGYADEVDVFINNDESMSIH